MFLVLLAATRPQNHTVSDPASCLEFGKVFFLVNTAFFFSSNIFGDCGQSYGLHLSKALVSKKFLAYLEIALRSDFYVILCNTFNFYDVVQVQ